MFGKHGYHGGSLRLIAAQLGIAPALVVHHFGSKEGLLMAVLRHWDEQSDTLTGKDFSGIAFIDKQRVVMRHNRTIRGLIELFASMSTEATDESHPAHDYFVARYERVLETFEHAFATARDAGEVHPGTDPSVEARGLIALMDGLQIQWLLDPTMPLAEVFDACIDALLARVATKAGEP